MKRASEPNDEVPQGAGDAAIARSAEQLAALGHPVRLGIVRFVVESGMGGAAAGEIQAHVELAASTLSHHLKRLTDAGLLVARPDATFIYYQADYGALRALTDFLWKDCCKRGKPADASATRSGPATKSCC